MAVGYTRFKVRFQHSPNSDYTDPNVDELVTVSLGQLHRVVFAQEKTMTTAESIATIKTDANNYLAVQNLSGTVTIAATIYATGVGSRIYTIPINGFLLIPGVDVTQSTLGGTADAACTARIWVFAANDTAS